MRGTKLGLPIIGVVLVVTGLFIFVWSWRIGGSSSLESEGAVGEVYDRSEENESQSGSQVDTAVSVGGGGASDSAYVGSQIGQCADASNTAEPLQPVISKYEAAAREQQQHFGDGGRGYHWAASMDLALKELIGVAFGQFGELDAVKAALGERVRWQPVPSMVRGYDPETSGGPTGGRLPENALNEPPTIRFVTYQSKEQDTMIAVMVNTFVTWDQTSVVLLDTYPYAAGRVNGRPFFSGDIAGISKITPEPSRSETYQLAGFVEGPGSLPAAVYFTQARGATFCAYVLNPEDMTWSGGCYEGWDTEFWVYGTEDHFLGLGGEEAFDVGQWVRTWVLKTEE